MTEQELQQAAARFVQQNVLCCLSGLVSTLANSSDPGEGFGVQSLVDQAAELASPVEDYEEAATQAGWKMSFDKRPYRVSTPVERENHPEEALHFLPVGYGTTLADGARYDDLDPYQWEVYEHWAIDSRLADELEALGEKVDRDFAGLIVWARTTTGQAISMDSCIRAIVRKLHAPVEG